MSAHWIKREGPKGPRYIVRYRIGGRSFPVRNAGSFKTQREADKRVNWLRDLIADGIDPAEKLAELKAPAPAREQVTVARLIERYFINAVDLEASTIETQQRLVGRLDWLAERDPETIKPEEISDWIRALRDEGLKPTYIKKLLTQLRLVLDLGPGRKRGNPARDETIRLPKVEREDEEPLSDSDLAAILSAVPDRYRLAIRVLDQTGCRIGELLRMTWADVEATNNRFYIPKAKTRAGKRWVRMPVELAAELDALVPLEQRDPAARVFPRLNHANVLQAMGRACEAMGISHYHPHDLRHRYISRLVEQGVPLTRVAKQVGHARPSVTLDVYSHVMPDIEIDFPDELVA
jgi:integrase